MNSSIVKYFVIAIVFLSCQKRDEVSSPTSGRLDILCDELVSSAIAAQEAAFEKNYPKASISLKLSTTNYAIGSLLNHDVECIISTRELDSTETDFLIRNEIKVYSQKLALDGIAFIVNAKNPIQEVTLDQIGSIITGRNIRWASVFDSISFPSGIDVVRLVIDGRKSGNYYLLKHQVLNDAPMTASAEIIPGDSVVSSSDKILNFIASHHDAIGYLSTAFLGNNPIFTKVADSLKVLRLAGTDYQKAVAPIPGYVYRGDYPLRRFIYIMHRQDYIGLAAGFTAYMTGNEGQQLFLQSNLVPAMNPIRLVPE
ncbi:substrate-binding domain-containing protein [bacterium]|nr:substrate-binding domain-containing protein [bacterium]